MFIRIPLLTAALILVLSGISGCTSTKKVAENDSDQRGDVICTEQAVTGTRIKRKVCRTQEQIAYEKEQSRKALNRALGTAGATSGN